MDFASIGRVTYITQRCNQTLKQIQSNDPMIVYVINGEKQIECEGEYFKVKTGQLVLIPAGNLMNINNFYIDDKDYQAICYSWHAQLLDQFALSHLYQSSQILKKIKVETILPETFITRLIQIKTELLTHNQCNSNLVKHLFIELLIRLSAFGVYFPLNNNPKISQKIREIINQQPDKKWQAAEIAKQFAMSESTLRRHLALEGYNLSKIILDIRMNFGLMLLQTTQKTILQIAQEVGYESGSRFAFYFKQRFGFSPKRLR
ncbi:helix-turn-helix domain-containing protein [Gilliamella sp. BG1]|uniref:helix-turn-helix domain-containing protein n=1 Tax=Gilliamella sp. BG1 TaxID=3351508 RepID=UPI003988690A